jgi:hypothetical protein
MSVAVRSKKQDIAFGLQSEQEKLCIFEKHFQTKLTKHNDPYYPLDFHNETNTIYVELKSRHIRHNQYETTLISAHKVSYCCKPDVSYYFVFAYTDGLYYIKYEKELFDTFETRPFKRYDRVDDIQTPQPYIFIPVKHLTKI